MGKNGEGGIKAVAVPATSSLVFAMLQAFQRGAGRSLQLSACLIHVFGIDMCCD